MIGVYKIKNIINGKFYIGSSKNIKGRLYNHFHLLNKGKHYNKYFQDSFNKYGSENFISEIVELCDLEQLRDTEQKYLDILNPDYNSAKTAYFIGTGNKTNHSRKNSLETINKMKLGYIDRRDKHPLHKLKSEDVVMIIDFFNNGISILEISKNFNIKEKTVLGILSGRSWKDLYYLVNKDKYKIITNKRRGFNIKKDSE